MERGEAEEEHKHVATIQRANAGESVTGLITSLITTRPAQSALILASVSIQEGCIVDGFRETSLSPSPTSLSWETCEPYRTSRTIRGHRGLQARGMQLHRRHHTLPRRTLIPSARNYTYWCIQIANGYTSPTVSVPFMFRACWTDRNRLSGLLWSPACCFAPSESCSPCCFSFLQELANRTVQRHLWIRNERRTTL